MSLCHPVWHKDKCLYLSTQSYFWKYVGTLNIYIYIYVCMYKYTHPRKNTPTHTRICTRTRTPIRISCTCAALWFAWLSSTIRAKSFSFPANLWVNSCNTLWCAAVYMCTNICMYIHLDHIHLQYEHERYTYVYTYVYICICIHMYTYQYTYTYM